MSSLIRKSFDAPEEIRPFEGDTGQLELVNLESGPVGRATFKPGWKWSDHVKPIAGTESCQSRPHGLSAWRRRIESGHGRRRGGRPSTAPETSPSWRPGTMRGSWATRACVVIDWQGFAEYAKR